MSFLKRAFLFCIRQKAKSLILFIVLSIVATLILTGFAIRDASKDATTDVKSAIGGEVVLSIDPNGPSDQYENQYGTVYQYAGDYITKETIDAISNVDGVVDCNAVVPDGFWGAGVNIDFLPAAFDFSYTPYGEAARNVIVLSSEKCEEFLTGEYTLVEGRHITPDDSHVILISKELADYNNLSVGDTITLYCLDCDSTVDLKILGLFTGTEGTGGDALTIADIPSNCGFVDFPMISDLFGEEEAENYTDLSVYVDDPSNVQNVYNKISNLPEVKGKTFILTIDTDEYDIVSTPLKSLQGLVNSVIVIISIISGIVLTLILMIWIRSRKKEIGILLSIGKSKVNIISQFFFEILNVAIFAFPASLVFSKLISNKMGEFILSKGVEGKVYVNVTISTKYLLPVYIIGFLIIFVSVILASVTVIRLKPKDILTKMS